MMTTQESKEERRAKIEQLKDYLRQCEQGGYVSNYRGWPRVWHKVLGACMASQWPWWAPRPTVIVDGTLGVEWYDWTSLTGAKADEDF